MDELKGPAGFEPADGSRFILKTRCELPDQAKRPAAFARIITSSEIL